MKKIKVNRFEYLFFKNNLIYFIFKEKTDKDIEFNNKTKYNKLLVTDKFELNEQGTNNTYYRY